MPVDGVSVIDEVLVIDEVKVIDGDGHVVEPPDLWSSRMDTRKWGDWVPRLDAASGKRYVGGEVRNGGVDALHRASELSGIPFERIADNVKRVRARLMRKGGWDPGARLEDMDHAGRPQDALRPEPRRRGGGIDVSVPYPAAV